MSLQALPYELIDAIFYLLGPTYFQRNSRRLTVSKWWYKQAFPVHLSQLNLSGRSIGRLIALRDNTSLRGAIREYVSDVEIGLNGLDDWTPIHAVVAAESGPHYRMTPELRSRVRNLMREWTAELSLNMYTLADFLRPIRRIKQLQIHAGWEFNLYCPQREARRSYLHALPLANLLRMENLQAVVLDTSGTSILRRGSGTGPHFCHKLNGVLLALKSFRCRMCHICPHILTLPKDGTAVDIEELIINMSRSEESGFPHSYFYTKHCAATVRGRYPRLRDAMEEQAVKFRATMSKPRIFRILAHTYPARGMRMHSFDVLAGRRMTLDLGDDWDADGPEVMAPPRWIKYHDDDLSDPEDSSLSEDSSE